MAMTDSTIPSSEKPVWLITGCSTGFGRELAKHVIESGYRTVVTARNPKEVTDLATKGETLVLKLDVTDQAQIDQAIKSAEEKYGRIDVLVNNAGIGYFAAVEESEEDQIRRMFEINFFGLSRMIHAVLPGMRKHRKGFIVNFSSIGGLRSFPSVGYYNATKFAVEGLSEALWQEVEPLGIKVMLVEPSGFRTDWAGRSANESKKQIDDYAKTAGPWRSKVRAISGVGGLGHLAIQYAKAMGLHVCVIDIDDGKLAHATRLGAEIVINAKTSDPATAVKKQTGGGAHGVLITAPSLSAFRQGVGMTRKRGTCVLVGLPPGEFPTPLFDVVANCITIRGSFVGTRQDMTEALAFAAEGKVKADIELQPLSSINQILDRLQHGDVASRVVIDFVNS